MVVLSLMGAWAPDHVESDAEAWAPQSWSLRRNQYAPNAWAIFSASRYKRSGAQSVSAAVWVWVSVWILSVSFVCVNLLIAARHL